MVSAAAVCASVVCSGYEWWQLDRGWAVSEYLEQCGGAGWNKFGIGLVRYVTGQRWVRLLPPV